MSYSYALSLEPQLAMLKGRMDILRVARLTAATNEVPTSYCSALNLRIDKSYNPAIVKPLTNENWRAPNMK